MELPTSLDQQLQGQIAPVLTCSCRCETFICSPRVASNLQRPAALQHFLLVASMKCTPAQNTIADQQSPGLPRAALLDLDIGKSARKKKTTTDNCKMERQDSARPRRS